MTTPPNGDQPPAPPRPPAPQSQQQTPPMGGTPNAEKYVLQADAMRRRQLRSALLHGSRRTWREHPRIWPAIVVGVIIVAVVLAAIAVIDAYHEYKKQQEEEEAEQSASSYAIVRSVAAPTSRYVDPGAVGPSGPPTHGLTERKA